MTTSHEDVRRERVAKMSREELLERIEYLQERIEALLEDASAYGPRAMAGARWGNIADQVDALSHLLHAGGDSDGWSSGDAPASMEELMHLAGAKNLSTETMFDVVDKLRELATYIVDNPNKPKR